MRIQVKSGLLDHVHDGVVVVGALEGEERPASLVPSESSRDAKRLSLLARAGFRGALNETILLPEGNGWILVVGFGKKKGLTLDRVRQFGGTAAKLARNHGFKRLTLPLVSDRALGPSTRTTASGRRLAQDSAPRAAAGLHKPTIIAQALAEGALLGLYRYDKLRQLSKHEQRLKIEAITIIVERAADVSGASAGVKKAQILAESITLARDLINGPSNIVTPTALADEARKIARQFKLKCTVIPFPQLKRLGFGGIVGVAQGAEHPAQFIVLEYRHARAKTTYALCGKGITFDTGGINIKPSAKMELMKYDMSGAAAVLGTLKAVAALKLPVRVIGIIAATDNMPSGKAQKPGDVLKTLSGKTVEVLNTDAEGRLVLSDCLHYAKRLKPDYVIDLATLTGACVVALGREAIGLMANDDRLAARITEAGQQTHERVWRLPLWEEYGGSMVKSDIADLKNVTNAGEAGTITAGKFLEQFVEGMRWAHLDIAGTAWIEKPKPYVPKGAVGVGIRLLVELMSSAAS